MKRSPRFIFGLILGALFLSVCSTDTMNNFFPDIHGNLTAITWDHAVNNQSYLKSSLESAVMMLEADVIWGKLNGEGDFLPVMGHPPATQSDLTLEEFLTKVDQFNRNVTDKKLRKGVKLDFKSTEVVEKSVGTIANVYENMDYPLLLNADILRGPLNLLTVPVDPTVFLSTAKKFNKTIISPGWTTTSPNILNHYTDSQINSMIEAIEKNSIRQEITFPVRAGIAAVSYEQMNTLKNKVVNCTLTIWSSEGDEVDVPKLRKLIFDFGIDRCFVDVPKELRDELHLENPDTVGDSHES